MSEPHAVAAEEYRETIGLIDEVFRLSRGLPGTVLPEVPVVLGAANRSRMIVISELGRVVSHAAYQPQRNQTPQGEYSLGALSCVVTDEQFRGRGFASDLVRHLDGMMAGEGLDAAILWAIEPAFYRRLGYEEAGEEFSFDLSPELFRPARYPGDVRRFASADVPAMHRLQREKPHKVARAAEVFDALMNCPKERIYVAESGGRVAAYAVAGKGEDFPDFVVDWAGETPGVIACIAAQGRHGEDPEPGEPAGRHVP